MQYTEEAIKNRKNKIENIKKKINTLICIILDPLLIYNVSLLIQAIIEPNKTPALFGIKMYVIVSGSMEPELNIGDIVIVKENDNYQKDDVISFRQGQSVITHRIIEVINDDEISYKTKGDNNNTEDKQIVLKEDIEGKVINKIPTVGKFVLVVKDKTILIVIVLLYYIFLVRDQSIQKRKNTRKIKRERYEKKKKEELAIEEKRT